MARTFKNKGIPKTTNMQMTLSDVNLIYRTYVSDKERWHFMDKKRVLFLLRQALQKLQTHGSFKNQIDTRIPRIQERIKLIEGK